MNINQCRLFNAVMMVCVIAVNHFYCIVYIIVMQVMLEVFNRHAHYLRRYPSLLNVVFCSYELVLVERFFHHQLPGTGEWLLNSAEHLGFGLVVCLLIYICFALFIPSKISQRWKRGIIAVCIFNAIGVVNEIYQNSVSNRGLFRFIEDSNRDMLMNFLGGLTFISAVFFISFISRRTVLFSGRG